MRCIYCKQISDNTKGRAHIIPEAIVQNNRVLPLGAECDKCNKYFSQLETALVHHNHFYSNVQFLGLPGKKGKTRKKLGYVERPNPSKIKIVLGPNDIESMTIYPDLIFVKARNHHTFDEWKARRGLYHVAFNYLAYELGVESVLRADYDGVRKYIREANRTDSWPYAQLRVHDKDPMIGLSRIERAPGEIVVIKIFHNVFYMDLLNSGRLLPEIQRNLASAGDALVLHEGSSL